MFGFAGRLRVLWLAVACVVALAGCGGEPPPGAAEPPAPTDSEPTWGPADVAFLHAMLGYSHRAAELAAGAAERSARADLADVAARLGATATEHADAVDELLAEAGSDPPAGTDDAPPGTVTDDELQALGGLRGERFDRRFAELLIRHHEHAAEAAERAIEDGDSTAVADLAVEVIDAARADLALLTAWQQQWGPPLGPVAPAGLGQGDRGSQVFELERRLDALHFDVGTVDDTYDAATVHAVIAFQKLTGLPPSGRAGPEVVDRLASAQPPPPLVPAGGAVRVEIDLPRQVLFLYREDALYKVLPVSSGSGERYCAEGECGRAVTPAGAYQVSWHDDGWRKSRLGRLYRPVYFDDEVGLAIHGYPSVPTYPASHGCVRIPMASAEWFPDAVPRGTPVYVLDGTTPVGPLAG